MSVLSLVTTKSTRLAKTNNEVRNLAARLERALQSRNERHARADADYVDAVRRAVAETETTNEPEAPPEQGAPPTTAPVENAPA